MKRVGSLFGRWRGRGPERGAFRSSPDHSRPNDRAFDQTPTVDGQFLRRVWHSTRGQWGRFALIAFAGWSVYALVLSPHGWLRLAGLRREAAALDRVCERLAAQRDSLDQLTAEMDRCETYGLERRAREEFGFVRENERIYVMPADPEDARCIGEAQIHGADRFSDRMGSAGREARDELGDD